MYKLVVPAATTEGLLGKFTYEDAGSVTATENPNLVDSDGFIQVVVEGSREALYCWLSYEFLADEENEEVDGLDALGWLNYATQV